MKHRVVVTGIGVVSPVGTSTREFWSNCLAGQSLVERIPSYWSEFSDFKSTIWAPLKPIDYSERGVSRALRMQHDPVSLNTVLAAREAADNAGWAKAEDKQQGYTTPDARTGIYMGTGIGGAHTFMENHLHPVSANARKRLEALARDDELTTAQQGTVESLVKQMHHPRRVNPFMVSMLMPNATAALLGIDFSAGGPNCTYCMACASGTVAVGQAFKAIRDGDANAALAGGAEYFDDYHGFLYRAFDVSGTLVQACDDPGAANRPFDKRRSGFLFSQGASAILVLESLEGAAARQAPILAEVTGYGESFDAHSMMAIPPGGEQIEKMIRTSIQDAGLTVDDIDYVNAHGTGTTSNDQIESDVIGRVFGGRPLINSTKSIVGHSIGASGALEAAVLALSLRDQTTHPCRNLEDPIADLNFVTTSGHCELRHGLSQSFAFGGHNAALVMKRFQS